MPLRIGSPRCVVPRSRFDTKAEKGESRNINNGPRPLAVPATSSHHQASHVQSRLLYPSSTDSSSNLIGLTYIQRSANFEAPERSLHLIGLVRATRPTMIASTMAVSPSWSGSSSPLSSLASQSPPMPAYLPSPASQELSDTAPPTLELDSSYIARDPDGPPPAKKRRIMKPKPRKTRNLELQPEPPANSLTPDVCPAEQKEALDMLLKVLHKKRKIVVVAGAGISVSAGS